MSETGDHPGSSTNTISPAPLQPITIKWFIKDGQPLCTHPDPKSSNILATNPDTEAISEKQLKIHIITKVWNLAKRPKLQRHCLLSNHGLKLKRELRSFYVYYVLKL